MLIPIDREPLLVRESHTGAILSLHDFHAFETSEPVDESRWQFNTNIPGCAWLLKGWRFTCTTWPQPSSLIQQRVELHVDGKIVADVMLASILSIPDYQGCAFRDPAADIEDIVSQPYILRDMNVEARLTRWSILGVELRIHLRGLRHTGM